MVDYQARNSQSIIFKYRNKYLKYLETQVLLLHSFAVIYIE